MAEYPLLIDAIDAHVHTAPDVFPRRVDDQELVQNAQRRGMAGVVLKNHLWPTAARARLAGKGAKVRVWGGMALNLAVGGWNPWAVRSCLDMGGRIIWMPTVHARHMCARSGSAPMFKSVVVPVEEALTPLDDNGQVLSTVRDILGMIATADAVLATGHLSPAEVRSVVGEALRCGVRRIWLTHPFSHIVESSLLQVHDLLQLGPGIWVEMTANDCSAREARPLPLAQVAEWIRALGPERVIVTSDGGQMDNLPPDELLSWMLQGLVDQGLSAAAVRRMVTDNPRHMLSD